MNIDEIRSPANGAEPAPLAGESPRKTHGQKAANGNSRNRRTRGSVADDRSNASTKRSLPAQSGNGRPACPRTRRRNGRDHASQSKAARGAPRQPACPGRSAPADEQGTAASVDASGHSVASAADTPAASLLRQASTDRTACAEVAVSLDGGKRLGPTGAVSRASGTQSQGAMLEPRVSGDPEGVAEVLETPPAGTDAPLPVDIGDFVDQIHSRVDLFKILQDLLTSKDEKIKQRALERILEMKYGKGSTSSEAPQQIIFDMPRPLRD